MFYKIYDFNATNSLDESRGFDPDIFIILKNNMKRILSVITTSFVPYGGLTTVAMNYYRNIDNSIFHTDFASVNDIPKNLEYELQQNNSQYYKLPNRNHKPIAYMRELKKISRNYDIVHVHANSATALVDLLPAKLAGVKKRILHIHNTTNTHKIAHAVLNPFLRFFYTDAIACSEAAGKWIFDDYVVLNNSIDTRRYAFNVENRRKIRKQLGVENDTIIIGNVGKINEQKNHGFLLDIFKSYNDKNPDSKLIIIGDGSLRPDIEKKIINLGIVNNVILTGMIDDATPYYSAMDAFVFPSLWEGFPLSLLEAQANGLPCITSTNVTEEANVTDKVMYLDLNSAKIWGDAVGKIARMDRVCESTENAQLLIKRGFDIKTNARELERIYER